MSSIPIQATFGSLVKDRFHVVRVVSNEMFTTGEIQRRARRVSVMIEYVYNSNISATKVWKRQEKAPPLIGKPTEELTDPDAISGNDTYDRAVRLLYRYGFDMEDDAFIFDAGFPQITKLTADLFSAIGEKYKGNNGASLRDFICGWLNKAELPEDLSESHYVGLVRYALKVAGYKLKELKVG